jgi:MFS family permease
METYSAAKEELYSNEGDDVYEAAPLLNETSDEKKNSVNHQESSNSKKELSQLQLLLLCFYSLGFGALWTFLLVVALPKQVVALLDVTDKTKGRALGIVMLAGGCISAIEPPIVGYFSDRTKSRFGKRKPYMVIGSFLLVITMLFLPKVTNLKSYVILYVLMQFFSNISSSANLGLLPDLVPQEQLGRASGMMGAMGATGQLFGASSGLLISRIGLESVFWIIGAWYIVATMITVCCVMEMESKYEEEISASNTSSSVNSSSSSSSSSSSIFSTYTDAMFSNYDFRWVFITRLLYNMGIYSVQEFLQYYVKDIIPIRGWSTTTEVSFLFLPLLFGALFSAYFSGKLSDLWNGRRKIFLYISGIAQVLICLALMFNTNVGFAAFLALLFGLASGAFAAVDFAMVLDVLPSTANVARDLGVWHVSLVLPQLLSTPISGYLLDIVRAGISARAGYSAIFLLSAFWFGLSTVLVMKIKSVK